MHPTTATILQQLKMKLNNLAKTTAQLINLAALPLQINFEESYYLFFPLPLFLKKQKPKMRTQWHYNFPATKWRSGLNSFLVFLLLPPGLYGRTVVAESNFCMEWCRMFPLRIVVWTLLLGCGLSFPWPDIANSTSKREQKRQELLKMLEGYKPSSQNALVPAEVSCGVMCYI